MVEYILKSTLLAEIEKLEKALKNACKPNEFGSMEECMIAAELQALDVVKEIINSLEVIDPYKQCIQYSSIESGIKAHAEDYSWNIESELFQQLTPEQQTLWRKEIEQACISGGYSGFNLAKDPRYMEKYDRQSTEN